MNQIAIILGFSAWIGRMFFNFSERMRNFDVLV